MKIGGIVLCGGKSSRMGTSKAMLPFGTELMLQRVVRLLSTVVDPIVVVAAPQQMLPELPVGVQVARDGREGRGPLEGLSAGLAAMESLANAAYATSCDVPLLVPDFVRHMIEALGTSQIAVPVDGEFHHPLAAVYRTNVLPHINDLLARDQLRPFFLFERVATQRVLVESLRAVDPRLDTLRNLNLPADYEAALRIAGFTSESLT